LFLIMKTLLSTVSSICVLIPIVVLAQWPDHPARNVPRTKAGVPIMDGPTPRTADGHPDFSGIWTLRGGGGAATKAAEKDGKNPPPPSEGPPTATFRDVGQNIKGGLPFRPAAKALRDARNDEKSKDNPDAHCLPIGLMQSHTHPQPRKIIQTSDLIVMLYEAQAGIRQIFMDGRPLPKDVLPWWYGYSVGHWEGDTLVVETTGFRDDVWLDIIGSPLTETGKMTERFRRPNYGSLEMDITFEDPAVYTAPFTVRVNQRIMPDTDLIEFICTENDRSGPHLVGK
jgi:hypothetical protein